MDVADILVKRTMTVCEIYSMWVRREGGLTLGKLQHGSLCVFRQVYSVPLLCHAKPLGKSLACVKVMCTPCAAFQRLRNMCRHCGHSGPSSSIVHCQPRQLLLHPRQATLDIVSVRARQCLWFIVAITSQSGLGCCFNILISSSVTVDSNSAEINVS